MSRATFPAAARLHRPTEFSAALSGRRISRGAFLVVTAHLPFQPTLQTSDQRLDPIPAQLHVDASVQSLNQTHAMVAISVTTEPLIARLGLIIAKRFAHHASTRNALKRVIRESFRAVRLSLPPKDYVVRLHKPVEKVTLTELKRIARKEVDLHFQRAQQ